MLEKMLDALRSNLFDGTLYLCDYEKSVKSVLRDALSDHTINYSQWARLYYQYIG